jgi:hypothetical protein
MFKVIDLKQSQLLWVPVSESAVVYEGSIVQWDTDTAGVEVLGAASGAYDASNDSIVAGIVVGGNNVTKVYHAGGTVAGFAGEEITGVVSSADQIARNGFGHGGMYARGEKMAMVQIAVIDVTTRIRGYFYNAAYGTAPTLLTVTAGSTDGGISDSYVTNAADVAGVANYSTIFCRSGTNAGLYRVTSDTSDTTHTNDVAFPQATISVGDKFVKVFGKQGYARLQFDAQSLYINTGAATSAYYGVFIDYMNLKNAGNEYCDFRFTGQHLGVPVA